MNILVIGAGGREHTFCWKLAQSPMCKQLVAIPGNAGTAAYAKNIPVGVNDFAAIKEVILNEKIEMVVVGPEEPLVLGIHDFILNDPALKDVAVIGAQQAAATLEGSKAFAKEFMMRHQIPTAAYAQFSAATLSAGYAFLETLQPPYVLKADGLAAGKGVLIIDDLEQAKKELKEMLVESKFGKASQTVVIEEFLSGIELSCFVLTDGKSYLTLPMAKDYKRIGEGDTGLNTGGMGAISPVPFVDELFQKKIDERIVKPTISGLQKDKLPYKGFIFIGLIKVGEEPKVIEYNVRMGDPETEVVLPRIKNDLAAIFMHLAEGRLDEVELDIDTRSVVTVVAVSGGYPEAYKKGKKITGLEQKTESLVFHAGTSENAGEIYTNGGRVLAISSFGDTHQEALKKSYSTLENLHFEGINYRSDIGFDL